MKKATRFLVSLMLLLLIIASIIWYLFIYDRAFTRDTLLSQARYQAINGNSRLSSWFYDCAYNFSGHDENVAIELANQYKKTGNYTKAELTLTTSIRDNPTVELYTALSEVFVEQDKLLDAVSLLEQIPEGSIRQEIENQRPSAPQADQEPGFFSQYIDVHLTTDGDAIFYTTDGDYPSMAGDRYSSGITLPAGETKIRAIAVKENGLVSRVADLDYTVTGVIEKAEFQDAAMEAAIRELIHTSATTTVYTDALWGITEFTVPEGTKNFSDLAYLPNLTSLTINGLEIPSLECLTPLSKLVVLDLTGSSFPVDDLKILGTLPSLSSLTMAEHPGRFGKRQESDASGSAWQHSEEAGAFVRHDLSGGAEPSEQRRHRSDRPERPDESCEAECGLQRADQPLPHPQLHPADLAPRRQ